MTRYRKRPVLVDAIQNTGEWVPIVDWLGSMMKQPKCEAWPDVTRNDDGSLNIRTLEGTMKAKVGDWLICGVEGEFYPCKPAIFETTYEPVVIPVPCGTAP